MWAQPADLCKTPTWMANVGSDQASTLQCIGATLLVISIILVTLAIIYAPTKDPTISQEAFNADFVTTPSGMMTITACVLFTLGCKFTCCQKCDCPTG